MGNVYHRLHPATRLCLISAEQVYRSPEFARPSQIVGELAQGFEHQAKEAVFGPLCNFLVKKVIREFPPPVAAGQQILKDSQFNWRCNLGDLARALQVRAPAVSSLSTI
jgi:hypothetical protein